MTLGFMLILLGIVVMLLDWLLNYSFRNSQKGEIKIGFISIKGGLGFLIFISGLLVYLIEEELIKL